jgi:AGCS family alanine or glycine:cation symporter
LCAFKKNKMKKIFSLILLLSPFLIFAQSNGKSVSDSTFEVKHYFEVTKSAEKGVFSLLHKTDTIRPEGILTIDEKIDKSFRPVADGVGSVIFYPLSIGELSEVGVVHISDSAINANKDGVLLSLDDLKIGDLQKAPENFIVTSGNGVIEKIDGQYFLKAKQGGDFKVLLTATKFSIPIVLIVLILGALFFTIYFKFANFTLIGKAIKVVRGDYDEIDKHGADVAEGDSTPGGDVFESIKVEDSVGEVTHFQALTAALSATVGLGNIAGVAVAIAVGGPGATLWMILAGLLGMASKFVECTLGVKYREVTEDGTVHGGPMYYLSKGLKEKGLARLGKFLAVFFAIMCVGGSFGGGNMFQANQAAAQITERFGIEGGSAGFIFGIIMAIIVGVVIIGGIKRIGSVTEKVVPFMAVIYVGAALIIIGMNYSVVPEAFGMIFNGAFTPDAALGGVLGVLIVGFQRAAFSNEAGVGSAAIAHSAVKTKYAASEGVVALLEPFIDTVIICTMTALVIIITNIEGGFLVYGAEGVQGVELTTTAFESAIPGFSWVLTIAVVLFAISTMLSWSYYGLQAWKFLFGRGKSADIVYKVLFLLFVIVGASISLGAVIDFSDAMIFAMVFPNVIGLFFLAPVVRDELKKFLDKIKTVKK